MSYFFKSFVTFILYYFTFCYFYKFVNFKERVMFRYCVIVVDHVTCSCCIMCSFSRSLKGSVILTNSGSCLSRRSQMGKCTILLACSKIAEVCVRASHVSLSCYFTCSHITHFAAFARKLINKTVLSCCFKGVLRSH